jgi:hypothetical protein
MTRAPASPHAALLRNLAHEVFQTETSAAHHCRREAERHGDMPPARALRAVAEHAEAALGAFRALAEREDLPPPATGNMLGEAFSSAREYLGDRLTDAERSYRGTLLGVRHGLDVVRMLGQVAAAGGRPSIAAWADDWLAARGPLVPPLEDALSWFAAHPEEALARAR